MIDFVKEEAMDDKRKECIFLWFIENYSCCWHKNGERLISPEFIYDDLEGTAWSLSLYPRGHTDKEQGIIDIFLSRSLENDGPEDFPLMFELALLATDGSPLISRKMKSSFKKGVGYGLPNPIRLDDVLLRRKAEFLPQDTLSVRCKIWRKEGKMEEVKQITARTRIGIEEISFLHVIESFSILESNQVKTIHIKSPSQKGFDLSSSLYFSDDSCCKDKIFMEITSTDKNQIPFKCTFFLVGKSGKLIKCSDTSSRLNTTKNAVQKLPLNLTKQDILNQKSDFLPGDKLSLLCECYFSNGVQFEKIERIWHEMPPAVLNKLRDKCYNNDGYNTAEKLSAYSGVADDLKAIYNNQVLTDTKLKTKVKTFPAHKLVLCARSSVFKAMLSNDMKECNTNCIEIDDLDDDTVQRLLLFLYSDTLENLQWESAIKLYYAADKYEVEKLKVLCATFLIQNVTTSSASELLLLADIHNDSDLKKAVEDFIFEHETEVFSSNEWRNLLETNSLLVSKTMCLKYMKNV